MKTMKHIPCIAFLFIIFAITMTSCSKRISCDNSDEHKLGDRVFVTLDDTWNIEDTVPALVFIDVDGNEIELTRQKSDSSELRVNDHLICEEIDIKPFKAYAYYNYPRLDHFFTTDSTVLTIEPRIMKEDDDFNEYLYINYAYGISEYAKAAIPVSENATMMEIEKQFDYYESISIQDSTFEDVWYFQEGRTGIVYSQEDGIVALEKYGSLLTRNR